MMFETKYRVGRDSVWGGTLWAVYYKVWWWPFWLEWGNGLLHSKADAYDLIETLKVVK